MKRWIVDPLIVLALVCALFAFKAIVGALFQQDPTPLLSEANVSYVEGEKAGNQAERKEKYNRALQAYSSLEDQYHPIMGNGKLYYNLANAFYQVEAYPWAILNYYKAAALSPRNERIQPNLKLAMSKLNLPFTEETSSFEPLSSFHTKLSIPERIQVFCVFTALAFLLFSLYLWTEHYYWRLMGMIFACLTGVMLISLSYSYYLAPLEGVIVRSTLLYRDAGTQYAPVSEDPAPSGQKIRILDTLYNGRWLKVQTPTGTVGFVPSETLRLISS